MVLGTLQLPLDGFHPTGKNYTHPGDGSCLVCQKYDEVDAFAKAVTLDKMHKLFSSVAKGANVHPSGEYKPGIFDATTLWHHLVDVREPDWWKYKTPKEELKEHLEPKVNQITHLRDLLLLYDVDTFMPEPEFEVIEAEKKAIDAKVKKATDDFEKATPQTKQHLEEALTKLVLVQVAATKDFQRQKDVRDIIESYADDRVQAVGIALWTALLKAKATKGYNTNVDDPVMRARLFYAWLGYSIAYDVALTKKMDRQEINLRFSNALASGKEICGGYAGLFKLMFDGARASGTAPARKVWGWCRQLGGTKPNEWQKSESSHMWNSFPLTSHAVSFDEFKVIDVCWGCPPPHSGELNPMWFSISNGSFFKSHMPDSYADVPVLTKAVTLKQIWDEDQPNYPVGGYSKLLWIDKSTLDPAALVCKRDARCAVNVQFRNNCEHQALTAPKFFLFFLEGDGKFSATTHTDGAVPFVEFSEKNKRPVWKASITVSPKKAGSVILFTVSGNTKISVVEWQYKVGVKLVGPEPAEEPIYRAEKPPVADIGRNKPGPIGQSPAHRFASARSKSLPVRSGP